MPRNDEFMVKPFRRLTRARIVHALTRLGALCAEAAIKVEISTYDGRVMMFAYDCRKATKDIDAIFHPAGAIEPLIRQVAAEMKLPEDWMNSGVKTLVGAREGREEFAELQIPGLVLTRPSAEYLLAMKCLAARLPTLFAPAMWRISSSSCASCGCARSRKSMPSSAIITETNAWRMGNVGSWKS